MKVYIQTELIKDETIDKLLNDAEDILFGLLDALGFGEEEKCSTKSKCACKKEEEIDFDSLPIPENVKA